MEVGMAMGDDQACLILNPLSEVTNYLRSKGLRTPAPQILNEAGEHFKCKLKGDLSAIPSINHVPLDCIPPNSLVRFRGMIQDMQDPEFYLGKYTVTNKVTKETTMRFGCYTDPSLKHDEEIDFENDANVTLARQTYYCVPVPGESRWLKDMFTRDSSYVPAKHISTCKKRSHVQEDDVISDEKPMVVDAPSTSPSNDKRFKSADGRENGISAKKEPVKFDKNIPLPNEGGIPCFVCVYSDITELKLNEVVEFVGILSGENEVPTNDCNGEMAAFMVVEDKHISLEIPRFHCVFYNKLTTLNPAVNRKTDLYENTSKELSSVRSDLIQLLTKVFGGDATVAEYFLLHLISSTYSMIGTMCVGKFSLNITRCPNEKFSWIIYNLIQNIVEKSYYLPLTIENLNKMKFTPKKDYEANRLASGILQLSPDTNLVLDETTMQPGKLDSDGVNNLKAIGNLIQWQNVEYDFKYSRVDMKTNVNVLVLSEGKSMLMCDCRIPIVSAEINNEQIESMLKSVNTVLFEKIRIYLSAVRSLEYNLTEEISKALEEDFVEMRKQDRKATTADTFHILLSTARYMALSYGQSTLDAPLWTRTKDLDAQRKERAM